MQKIDFHWMIASATENNEACLLICMSRRHIIQVPTYDNQLIANLNFLFNVTFQLLLFFKEQSQSYYIQPQSKSGGALYCAKSFILIFYSCKPETPCALCI